MTANNARAAQQRAFLSAFDLVLAGGDSRTKGLMRLRGLAKEGHAPALFALAEELVREPEPAIFEGPENWALAAYGLRYTAPIERLLAHLELAGEDASVLRARRNTAEDADPARSISGGFNSRIQEAIGMVEAGDPHRSFGLERLRKLAREGAVSAGLVYAEELVARAPQCQRAACAGWAESAAALGHHTPILRLIALMDGDGQPGCADQLRSRHQAILAKMVATEELAEVPQAADAPSVPAPNRGEYPFWPIKLALLLCVTLTPILFHASVWQWAAELGAGGLKIMDTVRQEKPPGVLGAASASVTVSTSAKAYLEMQMNQAEAMAETLLRQGKEQEADDAIVEAIEAAMIIGNLDALERLLDRQAETTTAIARAIEDDKQTLKMLREVVEVIGRGFDFTQPSQRNRMEREYVHYYAPSLERGSTELSCKLWISVGSKRGNPDRIFKSFRLTDNQVEVDLAEVYHTPVQDLSARTLEFVSGCPDKILIYKGLAVGFCGSNDHYFKAVLGDYLNRSGCIVK
ncbi:hypothetical protein MRS76_19505 [Rhizobiaceae bacterium n13]|uniref:hypothetical protein n=1 Tax=Ferirhizobium litorale TaxID=2927786 RepID=UPI0024B286C1|nr:hypothetical protein [Fererhizobium litorale]MDI7864136.1 hypothetical protein [Fererhizobium litorale]